MPEPMMREATSARRPWRQRSLVQLTLVRFREFLREPEAVFWTFVFPVLLAVGLGIAFRNKPADAVVVGVVTGTASGDSLATRLAASPALRVERMSDTTAARALRTGEVALVATAGAAGGIEYRFDDTRPEGRSARFTVDEAVQRGAGRTDPVRVSERRVQEKGSRYIDFVVPGLLGMNIMAGGIWGLGFAIVEARRRNLLKRLVSTPMPRAEYLASFLFSRFVFLLLEVGMILGCSMLLFGVPVRGSLLQLLAVCFIAALSFGGLGLLIASRAKTTEGVSGLMNLAMMPMWVLSGVFFSSSNFPAVAQPFIQALPLTATNNALRATMLQGAGWAAVMPSLAIVAAWGIGCFVVALRIFRWR
ncbi:MAG: ABC-type multidrug transport system, permease component [Gemmatimonadetes bacterium]|jgi:ABC-2 type transport system permease protein|nr:ABC-type multidrug transport system, permease component [Gemmatimonadota bacterium]